MNQSLFLSPSITGILNVCVQQMELGFNAIIHSSNSMVELSFTKNLDEMHGNIIETMQKKYMVERNGATMKLFEIYNK